VALAVGLAVGLPHLLDVEADPDLWWHLRTGELILERGAVPTADPFSFTAAGAPWVDHEWGAEVLFAGVFRLAGGRGLVALRALLLAAALTLLAALAWDRSRHPLGTVALVSSCRAMSSRRLTPKRRHCCVHSATCRAPVTDSGITQVGEMGLTRWG
jgi:hypothetical protein